MNVLIYIGVTIGVFLFMEGIAWFTHKYVMHGFLWYLHEDHHRPHKSFFEKNDWFFMIFAVPSMCLFYFGFDYDNIILNGIGSGILLYGIAYFFVHDIFIHQRFKILQKTKNKYLLGLRRAHKTHHRHKTKEKGECFGMLWIPRALKNKSRQA